MRPYRVLAASMTLLLVASLPASAGEANPPAPRKAGDRDPELLDRVDASVKKAVSWLLEQQDKDGAFRLGSSDQVGKNFKESTFDFSDGSTALVLLAILMSGVQRHEAPVEKGFAFLRKTPPKWVYSMALTVMAIEARWTPQKFRERIRGDAKGEPEDPPVIPPEDLNWMASLVEKLLKCRVRSGAPMPNGARFPAYACWAYPDDILGIGGGDHSNTQFAILALRSAMHCGVRVTGRDWKDVWKGIVDHFLISQETIGPRVKRVRMAEDAATGAVRFEREETTDEARGWAYRCSDVARTRGNWVPEVKGFATADVSPSMTSVGISSLVIALEGLKRSAAAGSDQRDKAARKAIDDALAWMGEWFTIEHWNAMEFDPCYNLYSMERAGVLAETRNFGAHDWYREGAEWLVEKQEAAGSWKGPFIRTSIASGPVPATAMALLFLTKATAPPRCKITPR